MTGKIIKFKTRDELRAERALASFPVEAVLYALSELRRALTGEGE